MIKASAHAMMVGIMAMTPVHLEHAGQALPLIMLAMSAHTGGMYVLSPVFGFLADSVGRRSTVLLGAFLLAASARLRTCCCPRASASSASRCWDSAGLRSLSPHPLF